MASISKPTGADLLGMDMEVNECRQATFASQPASQHLARIAMLTKNIDI